MKRFIVILAVALGSLGQTTEQQAVRTMLTGSRPLSEAADWLERKFGICVGYEDPQYRDPKNLEDVTAEVASLEARQKRPSLRVVVPRRATLEILSPPPTRTLGEATLVGIANAIVVDHNTRGNPGVFRVMSHGRRLTIAPVQGSDSAGPEGSEGALLDTRIQLPPLSCTTREALRELLTALGAFSRKHIGLGMGPVAMMSATKVDLPQAEGSARDLLIRILDQMKWSDERLSAAVPKVSWRLYFDQTLDSFVLNLHVVMVETKTIEGEITSEPLRY